MAKILLVEDDPLVVKMYRNVLSFEGFKIETAPNGTEGLKKAKEFTPDLIFLDIMMPKMNGIQVLEKLKSDTKLKDIPVIVLTNLAGADNAEEALKKGAFAYMVKSEYKPQEVAQKAKEFFNKKPGSVMQSSQAENNLSSQGQGGSESQPGLAQTPSLGKQDKTVEPLGEKQDKPPTVNPTGVQKASVSDIPTVQNDISSSTPVGSAGVKEDVKSEPELPVADENASTTKPTTPESSQNFGSQIAKDPASKESSKEVSSEKPLSQNVSSSEPKDKPTKDVPSTSQNTIGKNTILVSSNSLGGKASSGSKASVQNENKSTNSTPTQSVQNPTPIPDPVATNPSQNTTTPTPTATPGVPPVSAPANSPSISSKGNSN